MQQLIVHGIISGRGDFKALDLGFRVKGTGFRYGGLLWDICLHRSGLCVLGYMGVVSRIMEAKWKREWNIKWKMRLHRCLL